MAEKISLFQKNKLKVDGDLRDSVVEVRHLAFDIVQAGTVKLDDLAAPDDNTDLNASTSAHGLMPKGDGSATSFLNGNMGWSTPATSSAPTGSMLMWTTNSAPAGWLLCDGSAVSTTTYSTLYGIIAHTFASDPGGGNFTLPDMRGRVPLGQDDMGGASANIVTHAQADTIGGYEGSEDHTLIESEMPSHDHSYSEFTTTPGSQYGSGGGAYHSYTSGTTGGAGSGAAHENMPPYLTLNFIIKT